MTNQELKERLQTFINFDDKKSINTLSRVIMKHQEELAALRAIQSSFSMKTIVEAAYIVMHDMTEPHKCDDCHTEYTSFRGYHAGYKDVCGRCGWIRSADHARSILNSYSKEEFRNLRKLKNAEKKAELEQSIEANKDAWINIDRSEVKAYIENYLNGDPSRMRGISNNIKNKRPDIWSYIDHETKKYGFKTNSVVYYMILNDIEEPPKCIDCHTNYCAFYERDGKKQFSDRCTKCGLANGGVQADLSYCAKHGHSVFANMDLHKKVADGRFEKTGYRYSMQNPETLAKSLASANEHNGGTGFGSKKILAIIDDSYRKNHDGVGIFELSGTQERKDTVRNHNLLKYGETNWMKCKEYKQLFHNIHLTDQRIKEVRDFLAKYDLELVDEYKNASTKLKVRHTVCGEVFTTSSYNQLQQGIVNPVTVCKHCFPSMGKGASAAELELRDFILSIVPNTEVRSNIRSVLGNRKELDIFVPELNIAIEYCGLWCHSTNCDAYNSDKVKEPDYHYNKYRICKDKGIRLITIFDNENLDWYKDLIKKIITKTEHYELKDLELTKRSDGWYYLLDNKISSYEFFPLKDMFDFVNDIPQMATFWNREESIREDEFVESYVSSIVTDVFQLAHDLKYNWIFDCGYQLLKLKDEYIREIMQ